MSALAIPYAKHPERGHISPDEPQDGKGLRANVSCLNRDCGEPLVHRQESSDGRRAHYAHRAGSIADVASCCESAIHAKVKDLLAGFRERLVLPKWHGHHIQFMPISGEAEAKIPTLRKTNRHVDVLLTNTSGQRLGIEVWYASKKEPSVIADYRKARLPTLELRVTDEYIDATHKDLKLMLEEASWLIRPLEPFDHDPSLWTEISESFLSRREIELEMEARGFRRGPQCWEKSYKGLVARVTDSNVGRAVYPQMTWKATAGSQFQIENETLWLLEVDRNWDWPKDVLAPCRDFFREVANACESYDSGVSLSPWNGNYREIPKSRWASNTAVAGLRIEVDGFGNWKVTGNGYTVWNHAKPYSPAKLWKQITVQQVKPGITRREAESWARIFQCISFL